MRRYFFGPGYNPKRYTGAFTDRNRRVDAPAARIGIAPEAYEALVAAGLKWCCGCRNWHARAEFGPNRYSRDGLDGFCRDCRATYRRVYRRRARQAVTA
jgi:hypothetical protein